jgi:hypothetical protein
VQSLPFMPRAAAVLVVFDRSESMSTAFGERTRYDVAAALLADVLPAYDDKISFGFQSFPAKGTCATDAVIGCCADPPAVSVALHSSGEILGALQAAAPVSGNTPTALALRQAREHFAGLPEEVGERYVLLSTDGVPSCTLDGRLPSEAGTACKEAVAEVDLLAAAKVKVIVLGLGMDGATDPQAGPKCLEELGLHGKVQREDGRPGLFLAADREALETSLQYIFGAVARPSCRIDLEREAADPTQVRVRFDDHEIPHGGLNGWEFDPPQQAQHLRIKGEACRRLERFQVVKVDVQFGCAPCGEERACE